MNFYPEGWCQFIGPRAQRGINITPSQGVEIICSLKMHCIFSLYYSDYLQGYKQIYPLSVDLQGYKQIYPPFVGLQGYKQIYPPPDSQSRSSFTALYSINCVWVSSRREFTFTKASTLAFRRIKCTIHSVTCKRKRLV